MPGDNNRIRIDNSGTFNMEGSAIGSGNEIRYSAERPATRQAETLLAKHVSPTVTQQLLDVHTRALEALYLQQAQFGAHCPTHITLEIEDREQAVALLKQALA